MQNILQQQLLQHLDYIPPMAPRKQQVWARAVDIQDVSRNLFLIYNDDYNNDDFDDDGYSTPTNNDVIKIQHSWAPRKASAFVTPCKSYARRPLDCNEARVKARNMAREKARVKARFHASTLIHNVDDDDNMVQHITMYSCEPSGGVVTPQQQQQHRANHTLGCKEARFQARIKARLNARMDQQARSSKPRVLF